MSRYQEDPEFRERVKQRSRDRRARLRPGYVPKPPGPKAIKISSGERFVRVCPLHLCEVQTIHEPNTASVRGMCPGRGREHEIRGQEGSYSGGTWWCFDAKESRLYAIVKGDEIEIMSWREKTPEITIDSVTGGA